MSDDGRSGSMSQDIRHSYFHIYVNILIVMVEVGIGIIPAPLLTIIQVILVYHWVFLLMVTT